MKINPMKIDKMRYQVNGLGQGLTFLSLLCSIVALFVLITYDNYGAAGSSQRVIPDFRVAIEIGIGILTLLGTFLCAEKVKYYDAKWTYVGVFVLATINFIRSRNLPVYCFEQGWIPASIATLTSLLYIFAGIILLVVWVISSIKVFLLSKHLSKGTQ